MGLPDASNSGQKFDRTLLGWKATSRWAHSLMTCTKRTNGSMIVSMIPRQRWIQIVVIGHVVRVSLKDQMIRRRVDHRFERRSRDSFLALDRLERLGRTRQENPKPTEPPPRPVPF